MSKAIMQRLCVVATSTSYTTVESTSEGVSETVSEGVNESARH